MAPVYNYKDDMVATAFISGMQVTHSYKHLLKHEVTKMRDILTHAQKYIQIEDGTQSSANRSPKRGGKLEKQKAQPDPPKKVPTQAVGAINKPARNLAKVHGDGADLTPLKIPVDQVYNAIKGQKIIRHPRPLSSNPKRPRAGKYCAFHDGQAIVPWTVVLFGDPGIDKLGLSPGIYP